MCLFKTSSIVSEIVEVGDFIYCRFRRYVTVVMMVFIVAFIVVVTVVLVKESNRTDTVQAK